MADKQAYILRDIDKELPDAGRDRYQTRAYFERDTLIAVLSKIWPSHLMRHPEDDPNWQPPRHTLTLIVCIHTPVGRLAWHISDEDGAKHFAHLKLRQHDYLEADSAERYQRLASWEPSRAPASVAFGQQGGRARAVSLSAVRRSEIARAAALTRWAGHTAAK